MSWFRDKLIMFSTLFLKTVRRHRVHGTVPILLVSMDSLELTRLASWWSLMLRVKRYNMVRDVLIWPISIHILANRQVSCMDLILIAFHFKFSLITQIYFSCSTLYRLWSFTVSTVALKLCVLYTSRTSYFTFKQVWLCTRITDEVILTDICTPSN